MGWIWSDELAATLRKSPEFATLIPSTWSSQPAAFALRSDETPLDAARRLLGLEPLDRTPVVDLAGCNCLQAITPS